MAKNNRHNAAFVVGSVLGAVVGAGAALWKTPYTGQEMREKLTGAGARDGQSTRTVVASPSTGAVTTGRTEERSIKDKVLASVEKTLAPIVGVELGKTANGSRSGAPGVVADPDIRVKPEHTQRLGRTFGWTGTEETAQAAAAHAENGGETLGLHRDRVDADKWAAAYGGASETQATSTPAASSMTTTSETTASEAPADTSTTRTSDGGGSLVGQSRDRFSADRWAAAYGTQADTSSTNTTSYETTGSTSVSGTSSAARESAEETGQGAKPAYPGDDGDVERHPPVDRGTSENVAPATRQDDSTRSGREFAADAASLDQLTRPQTDRIPDSMRKPTERGLHPFPKLGGKES